MAEPHRNRWLHYFAVLTALATLGLVGMGGLVTSKGVGMAVPDWPTSYDYNMFALPISVWLTGGVFYEHTHRLWASIVGTLVVVLTRWLGGHKSRRPLAIVGVSETIVGFLLPLLGPDWKGAGYFLSGIGGVVILAAVVWVRNAPAPGSLPRLGWLAFALVQLQGLLGGLRVLLDAQVVAGARLGTVFGIFHATLGQAFLVLLFVIALLTSRWWWKHRLPGRPAHGTNSGGLDSTIVAPIGSRLALAATLLILFQLVLGATMRHQHAGLAIPDFPLAYGRLWPDTSPEAVAIYNERRMDFTAPNPITAFQIDLQMAHRLVALTIAVLVGMVMLRSRRAFAKVASTDTSDHTPQALRRLSVFWFGLILVQIALGAWTIWSNKAADIATMHVVVGALSLVTGTFWCLIAFRRFEPQWARAGAVSGSGLQIEPIFESNPATAVSK